MDKKTSVSSSLHTHTLNPQSCDGERIKQSREHKRTSWSSSELKGGHFTGKGARKNNKVRQCQDRTDNLQSLTAPVPGGATSEDAGPVADVLAEVSHPLADIKRELQRWCKVQQGHFFLVPPNTHSHHGVEDVIQREHVLRKK